MDSTKKPLKVPFIGESWHIHIIHPRGYDSSTSSKYEEGVTWLLQCLKNSRIDITYVPAHTVQIALPEDVAQLEQYNTIVTSNIGSNTFLLQSDTFYQLHTKPNALELIKEYVNNGGGSLMISGYLLFMGIEAKANYRNTIPADVLLVTMLDDGDRAEKLEGAIAQPSQPEHPVIKGFSKYPFFLGYNRMIVKENVEVVLTINNDPLLVFGNYHNGEITCFVSNCSLHRDTQQLMSWPFYTALWVSILTHITRQ